MSGVPVGAARRLRVGIFGFAAVAAMLVATFDTAEARKRKRVVKKTYKAQTYNPKAASIVLDVKSGATLHASNADALRHPASLTKIMTLYMLFERLESGRLTLNSRLPVSAEAASQPPTKLGLKPGQTLAVEDAIQALVTKSANDAAVVVAEALAGSEDAFARQMTQKARALGMRQTVYRNASGLPDPAQVTTAREQALLGQVIQERFPRYYRYFSATRFVHNGRAMRNHNKLLGRVHGVDGIKTGYIRASGFNLVTSMHRADRHVVAVVLGGRSAGQRDATMRSLLESHIMQASVRRTRTMVAESRPTPPEPPRAVPSVVSAGPKLASAGSVPVPAPQGGRVATGSTDPIKPVLVRTVTVRVASAQARAVPVPQAAARPADAAETPRPGILGALPVAVAAAGDAIAPAAQAATRTAPVRTAAARPAPAQVAPVKPAAPPKSGWAIQVGAYEAESQAKQRLDLAKSKVGMLKNADPYTEKTQKGEKTYFRARFAGFERDEAEAACKQLKRADFVCMTLRI